jgi:hypothetical protein
MTYTKAVIVLSFAILANAGNWGDDQGRGWNSDGQLDQLDSIHPR